MIKVAINGFGRIGRLTFRELIKLKNIEVVAINDLTNAETLAHLLKYDSNQGRFDGVVSHEAHGIIVNNKKVDLYRERNPEGLPWAALEIDVVVECTGIFTSPDGAGKHLTAGAKKVVISAPAKGDIKTIVFGVNDDQLSPDDLIVSNASCTTNCLAPIVKILDQEFGLERGYINTIHAYTADQKLQDAPHSDLRRARAAASSIIPTSTGAAKAVGLVLPHLNGKLDGVATRVPTPTGSMTDLVAILKQDATAEQINAVMKTAADGPLKGILEYTEDPIVSIDIVGNTHSSIFDSKLTSSQGNFVRVVSWYDNEYGYSTRTAELVAKMF